MTWSLKLHDGDLQLGGNGLEKATDETKLTQDLRCHILQKMGENDLHPMFGSLLDGGTTPDGRIHASMIGMDDKQLLAAMVRTELQRILSNYQDSQLVRAKLDKVQYGKASLTPKEVLFSVSSINISYETDHLYVSIGLVTGDKGLQTLQITF